MRVFPSSVSDATLVVPLCEKHLAGRKVSQVFLLCSTKTSLPPIWFSCNSTKVPKKYYDFGTLAAYRPTWLRTNWRCLQFNPFANWDIMKLSQEQIHPRKVLRRKYAKR